MKNSQYWTRRFELLEESLLNKGERYLTDLDKQFRIATREIEKEINDWYRRFAKNNDITMAEARKWLTANELKEFKWTVYEYIEYGQKNALNPQWIKQLENASAKVHIARLESLKIQVQNQAEVLYGNQLDSVDRLMRDIYREGYYHTAWEIQRGFNVGFDLHAIDTNRLDKILSRPWSVDGKTFSNKIWENQETLINKLQTELTQSVITGRNPDELIRNMRVLLGTNDIKPKAALYQAGRLVMTESAAFASAAQKDCFNELDVERYQIVATLDEKTSDICQDLDGQVFDMKNYEVGVTAPPFHPWCRTTTVPFFEDEYGKRAARDAEGKIYYVPANMTYKEWEKKFVK